jgi:hypothetical protein
MGSEETLLQVVQQLSSRYLNKCIEMDLYRSFASVRDYEGWKQMVIEEFIKLRREKEALAECLRQKQQ